jgi:triphosphatase
MKNAPEIELKLEIEPEYLTALKHHPALAGKKPKRARLDAVYYDTPKSRLARKGISLRVRREGKEHVQTVKEEAHGGVVARMEWEAPVDGGALDRKALRRTPAGKLLNGSVRKLAPRVETHVERTRWHVSVSESTIEVAVDEGEVVAGGRARDVAEVELELKGGPAENLFALAQSLGADLPLRLGVASKYQQGQALLSEKAGQPRKTEPIALDPEATAAEALRAIVYNCLRHYRLNEKLLLQARDVDALHQCRVALRRLRCALSLFKGLVRDERSQSIGRALKEVASEFGKARNLDVFLAGPAKKGAQVDGRRHHSAVSDDSAFLEVVEARRHEAYDALFERLDGSTFRHLIIEIVAWAQTGEWSRSERSGESLRDFGRRVLRKRLRTLVDGGRDLAALSPEDRHKVRIRVKKLRYGCEFFAAISGHPKRYKRFLAAVSQVQETLGDLNDSVAAQDLVRSLVKHDPSQPASVMFSAGAVFGSSAQDEEPQLAAAQHAFDAFARARPFW